MSRSPPLDPKVQARIERIIREIKDSATGIAYDISNNAEQRGTEIFETTVSSVMEKLELEYVREEEEIQRTLKIREAQIKNNVKLEILKSQTEAIHECLNQALVSLCKFSESSEYPELLKRLIAEGLDRLKESRVRLMVRKSDLSIAQSVLNDAVRIAQELNPGLTIKAKFDESRFLPQAPNCAGGVVLIAQKGKIRVSNILNDRLRLAYEGMLPNIRALIQSG
jgi:V-type H+-transporting ATPase subunit E